MKRSFLSILAASLLMLMLSIVVLAQTADPPSDAQQSQIQPVQLSVQQRVPISLTVFTPANSTAQVAKIPLVLDVNFEVSLVDTLTTTLATITPLTPPTVTVTANPVKATVTNNDDEQVEVDDLTYGTRGLTFLALTNGLVVPFENIREIELESILNEDDEVVAVAVSLHTHRGETIHSRLKSTRTVFRGTTSLAPFELLVTEIKNVEFQP